MQPLQQKASQWSGVDQEDDDLNLFEKTGLQTFINLSTGSYTRTDPKPVTRLPAPVTQPMRSREVRCLKCQGFGHISMQCPNKKTMIVRASGEIESEEEEEGAEGQRVVYEKRTRTEGVQCDQDGFELEGELVGDVRAVPALVVRRILVSTPEPDDDESIIQRENLFHSHCVIQGRRCLLVVDSGSCTNLASTLLVNKSKSSTLKHPKPYHIHWLGDNYEMKVTKQVWVSFFIGGYADKVLCDVVPMLACHLLLGRPWQYDRRCIYDGHTNECSVENDGRRWVLLPLKPELVREDQERIALDMEELGAHRRLGKSVWKGATEIGGTMIVKPVC